MTVRSDHQPTTRRFQGDTTLQAVYDGRRVLRTGDHGSAVMRVQESLIDAGFRLPRYGADGQFGAETKAAVEAFQRDAGLSGSAVDGIVGSTTLRLLDQRLSRSAGTAATDRRSLKAVYETFERRCECGEVLDNNCAHYLSDAFIRAGYDELDGGPGSLFGRRNGRIVCRAGRPVRARELREWFAEMATDVRDGEPNDEGYWAVFQHDPREYWGGHVVLHRHDGTAYQPRGTGDYRNWRTQTHYRW